MKILVACEYSGTVRDAFRKLGHDAWSCDILPSDGDQTYHFQCDVLSILDKGWDMMIAHPPCTHLAVSGAKHFKEKIADGRQQEALAFVQLLIDAPIPMIAVENPVSIISSKIRKPDQIIQPYEYGDPYRKTTCLWLKGLPKLVPTKIVEPLLKTYKDGSRFSADYGWSSNHKRNKTYQGIADAMAQQWSITN
jgi:site-specific DNA-cytosine methylase